MTRTGWIVVAVVGLVLVVVVVALKAYAIGAAGAAAGVAAALSAVWWWNARTASKIEGWGAALAYAAGAGCGTALGLWVGGM